MRFLILCIGTYGDVAPYVALGTKLKQEGHDVTIGPTKRQELYAKDFYLNFILLVEIYLCRLL